MHLVFDSVNAFVKDGKLFVEVNPEEMGGYYKLGVAAYTFGAKLTVVHKGKYLGVMVTKKESR